MSLWDNARINLEVTSLNDPPALRSAIDNILARTYRTYMEQIIFEPSFTWALTSPGVETATVTYETLRTFTTPTRSNHGIGLAQDWRLDHFCDRCPSDPDAPCPADTGRNQPRQ